MRRGWVVIIVSLALLSCTYAISKETRQTAVKDASYSTVKTDIEKHKGSVFIFGGFIAKNRSGAEGTWLEVVQNPTDKYGNILDTDFSEGRFLALYNGTTLDPLIYEKGRLVTVAGELTGAQKSKIGQFEYEYPVFVIKEIYLWREAVPYADYDMFAPYPWWYNDPWRWWYSPYYWPY